MIPVPDTPERARVQRICLVAWVVSLILATSAPIARGITQNRAAGPVILGACVVVMLICLAFIRKDFRASSLAISMSVAGISIGGAIGFLSLAFATGKPLTYVMAVLWEGGGIWMTWLFLKLLRQAEWVPPRPPTSYEEAVAQYEAVSKEAEEILARIEATNRRGMQVLLFGTLAIVCIFVLERLVAQ